MECGKIDINENALQAYLNPPMCTVPEVLTSRKKRRLSCQGYIQKVCTKIILDYDKQIYAAISQSSVTMSKISSDAQSVQNLQSIIERTDYRFTIG
jgi:hypothetical protein